ncbi:major facilitator transporter [Ralstonia mannitolilytica]|uniref:MFS transporter n=1 Tax=Ralstonia mannitolilytica TaxID=105219 RepID=UPI0005D9A995|nr:MFS transporter [Ralstonia mannitolilytica]AJW47410.1 major facilitator transporter [Ralstonia mannitolilytica]
MLEVLANRTYRHLFLAQIIALVGTGLATVALGLLAYDLAGADAGSVLGTALAIKMVAYVGIAPVVGAFANRLPRRAFLVSMDLIRAGVAISLPFVTQVWQIYILIFLLQSASAAFTPTFQATIPDVLPEEKDYTRALSLSRLAYDMESLASPALAAALLSVISFHWLFGGTVIGFLVSAGMVMSVRLPQARAVERTGSIYAKTFRGMSIYLRTPRLRGLLALNLAAAAASSMVIVNTVVYVQSKLQRPASDVPFGLAAFGFGSMLAALLLPRLLNERPDRPAMLTGATIMTAGLAFGVALAGFAPAVEWPAFLLTWFIIGIGYSMTQTPSGRLLKRSARSADRPAVFAAQFSLSHACWLITYPLAGQIGARFGMTAAFATLAAISTFGVVAAWRFWPADDPDVIEHHHTDGDAAHLAEGDRTGDLSHRHPFTIDDDHHRWPNSR